MYILTKWVTLLLQSSDSMPNRSSLTTPYFYSWTHNTNKSTKIDFSFFFFTYYYTKTKLTNIWHQKQHYLRTNGKWLKLQNTREWVLLKGLTLESEEREKCLWVWRLKIYIFKKFVVDGQNSFLLAFANQIGVWVWVEENSFWSFENHQEKKAYDFCFVTFSFR